MLGGVSILGGAAMLRDVASRGIAGFSLVIIGGSGRGSCGYKTTTSRVVRTYSIGCSTGASGR